MSDDTTKVEDAQTRADPARVVTFRRRVKGVYTMTKCLVLTVLYTLCANLRFVCAAFAMFLAAASTWIFIFSLLAYASFAAALYIIAGIGYTLLGSAFVFLTIAILIAKGVRRGA
jgi:uncharacterized protein involved in cysteine biosynthesis